MGNLLIETHSALIRWIHSWGLHTHESHTCPLTASFNKCCINKFIFNMSFWGNESNPTSSKPHSAMGLIPPISEPQDCPSAFQPLSCLAQWLRCCLGWLQSGPWIKSQLGFRFQLPTNIYNMRRQVTTEVAGSLQHTVGLSWLLQIFKEWTSGCEICLFACFKF